MEQKTIPEQMDNKNKIIHAAEMLIQEKGIAAASLSDIAASAGIAKGTLHYYFHSKSDLLFALAELQTERFSERFLELTRKKLDQNEREKSISNLVRDLNEQKNNFILIHLIMEGINGNDALKARFKQLYSQWGTTIKEGLELLCSSPVSDSEADFVLSSLIGLLFNTAVRGKSIEPDIFKQFILKGLAQ
jgi:AcrR family transcriptional regulator